MSFVIDPAPPVTIPVAGVEAVFSREQYLLRRPQLR